MIMDTMTLTNTEEKQCLHTEELFLGDLQEDQLLGEMSHPYAVLIHAGDVHAMSAEGKT